MNSVRVTAIACLMPLSELDEDPFLVDDRGQHDMCKQWAAARDYHLTCSTSLHQLRADHRALWRDVEEGLVDVFVAPNRRTLENAIMRRGRLHRTVRRSRLSAWRPPTSRSRSTPWR